MMKKTKLLLITVILVLSVFLSTGCRIEYGSEYPDLCSATWVNLPGVSGYSFNGEISYAPTVLVLETDKERRTLFFYQEDRGPYWHILIIQKSDDESVYYYPDDCYLSYPKGEDYWSVMSEEVDVKDMVHNLISAEELSAFKELNDWDQPINDEKCESTDLVTRKAEGKNSPGEARLEDYALAYYESRGIYIHPKNMNLARSSRYITCDSYGRELYLIESWVENYSIKSETTYYYNLLMVIMPDGYCDTSTIIQVDNPHECRDAVKQIKLDNNWNTPIN